MRRPHPGASDQGPVTRGTGSLHLGDGDSSSQLPGEEHPQHTQQHPKPAPAMGMQATTLCPERAAAMAHNAGSAG